MNQPLNLALEFKRLTPDQVHAFIQQVPRVIHSQIPAFDPLHEALGATCEWVGVVQAQTPRLVAKLVYLPYRRFFQLVAINYGPMGAETAEGLALLPFFLTELKRYLAQQPRVLRVRIAPLIHRHYYQDFDQIGTNPDADRWDQSMAEAGFRALPLTCEQDPSLLAYHYYVKPLAGLETLEAFWGSVSKMVVRQVRAAQRYGVQVRYLRPDEFSTYEQLMADTLRRTEMKKQHLALYAQVGLEKGTTCLYPYAYLNVAQSRQRLDKSLQSLRARQSALEAKIKASAQPDLTANGAWQSLENERISYEKRLTRLSELGAKWGEEIPLACAAFYFSPTDCVYVQGALSEEGMAFSANFALHAQMVEEAYRRGCQYYNFYAVSGRTDPAASDYGVTQFKRKFNGRLEVYLGNYEYLFHPRLFKWLERLATLLGR